MKKKAFSYFKQVLSRIYKQYQAKSLSAIDCTDEFTKKTSFLPPRRDTCPGRTPSWRSVPGVPGSARRKVKSF
jgi:hypothetical protein